MSDRSMTYSIFQEPWWLDSVAPGKWDAIEVIKNGELIGRMPFVFEKKFGIRQIKQPLLTQTLGPWILEDLLSPPERLSREHSVFKQLINQLPKVDYFHQHFHPHVTNWLAFHWAGFTQTTKYTYQLSNLTDPDNLLSTLSKKLRWTIRKAKESLNVVQNVGVDQILDVAEMTFKRQGRELPYDRDLLHRIDHAVSENATRTSIVIVDDYGEIHSGGYTIGDGRQSYLLVTGKNPKFQQSGSGELLHWNLICEAAKYTQIFDFEGSMLQGVEQFYRQFNPTQIPYFSIQKSSRSAQLGRSLYRLARRG